MKQRIGETIIVISNLALVVFTVWALKNPWPILLIVLVFAPLFIKRKES